MVYKNQEIIDVLWWGHFGVVRAKNNLTGEEFVFCGPGKDGRDV